MNFRALEQFDIDRSMHSGLRVQPVQGHRGFQPTSQQWREGTADGSQVHLNFFREKGAGFLGQGDTFAFQKTPLGEGVGKVKKERPK